MERHIVPTSAGAVIYVVIGLLFAILSFSFALNNFIYAKGLTERKHLYQPGRILPSRYNVEEILLSPGRYQSDRGTCWIFQIIGVMEAQYKLQALEKGYLKSDEHVRFSEEALGKLMVEKCQQFPENPVCVGSQRSKNTSTAGSFHEFREFVKEWPDLKRAIMPESCCPYQDVPEEEMKCPEWFDDCRKNNPIEFEFVKLYMQTNIRDVKQRVYETGFPTALSLYMPMQRYWFPCNLGYVKNEKACVNKMFKCPKNESEFCAPVDFKLYKRSDTEFIFENTGQLIPGTPHAMLLVGYNDAFVVKRVVNNSVYETSVGGFVVKNSWGDRGHSVEYLMGNITEDQEAVICPNKDDVFRWVPATLSCIRESNDPSKCTTGVRLQREKSRVTHADTLVCVNATHCTKGQRYVLIGEREDTILPSMTWSTNGVPLATVYNLDTKTEILMESLPLQHLYYAFQLENPPKNRDGKCAYTFFSYDTISDELTLGLNPAGAMFSVEGLLIRFTDESFAGSKTRGRNYNYILNSTKKFSLIKPRSVLDLDL